MGRIHETGGNLLPLPLGKRGTGTEEQQKSGKKGNVGLERWGRRWGQGKELRGWLSFPPTAIGLLLITRQWGNTAASFKENHESCLLGSFCYPRHSLVASFGDECRATLQPTVFYADVFRMRDWPSRV